MSVEFVLFFFREPILTCMGICGAMSQNGECGFRECVLTV